MMLAVRAFAQTHLPSADASVLYAACESDKNNAVQRACITDQRAVLEALIAKNVSLEAIAEQLQVALLDFSQPFDLQPVFIPKPWGQEIWYTGMEARGVSQVVTETGATPLSWLLSLASKDILGSEQQQLNLLKILDPLPEEVFGDLYFELHEKKREVYIVTHVDRSAWPDGVGAIRYGFSREKRAGFSDDASFLAAYQKSVREYAVIRREIDTQLDALRLRDAVDANAPVSAAQMQQWLQEVSASKKDQELNLRKAMEAFTALRSLRVGDVLAVPLLTPHALQHGVRTIEFQTPVYERKILSFAQKVLTQNHWDTEEALRLAQLETPLDQPFPVLCDADGVKLEQIVRFDDFLVQRLSLAPNAAFLCTTEGSYVLLMTVTGSVACEGKLLATEQASLVPACVAQVVLHNHSASIATVLLARPV